MKKVFYILLATLLLNCKTNTKENTTFNEDAIQVNKQAEPITKEKFVIAKSGLNYRKEPKGEVIGKFEYATKINIVKHSLVFETINDNNNIKKGEWLGVLVNNDTVYTFGAYLSNQKPNISKTTKAQEKSALNDILLPFTYRDWENKNPANGLNKNWLELNTEDANFYLNHANYTIKSDEDACTGDSTKTIIPKNKTLIYINNPNLKLGAVYSKKSSKNKIWPNEKVTFNYKATKYTIRAEGDIISTEQVHENDSLERYSVVENYKLYIATDQISEVLFLEEASFNDTFVKLLFVGDIDSDNKLDFIFEANRHYEEKRVILYLSTIAKDNEIIKKAAEIAIGFDC